MFYGPELVPDPGWVVAQAPPPPFPYEDDRHIDHALFGPGGTYWTYFLDDLVGRNIQSGLAAKLVLDIQRRVHRYFPLGYDSHAEAVWLTPGPLPPETHTMQVMKLTIHGKVAGEEEVAHSLHFVTGALPGWGAVTTADCDALGAWAVSAWADFLDSAVPGGTVRGRMLGGVTYDEVRVAGLTVLTGVKPHFDVLTRYFPIVSPNGDTTNPNFMLPHEVACCLSLGTGVRGPAHRGRLYLGTLTADALGSNGLFNMTIVEAAATAFGAHMLASASLAALNFVPVVASYKNATALPISALRVGKVPDSQRSRRRSLLEAYSIIPIAA